MTPANDNRPPAFDALLLAHEPYIRSRMYSLEKDATKHEDIYQEVIANALEKWSSFRRDGNFAGWLYWVVRGVVFKRECSIALIFVGDWALTPNGNKNIIPDFTDHSDPASTTATRARLLRLAGASAISEPVQEYLTDISLALSKMPRADEVLLHACGHSEADIARRAGVTPAAAHYRIKAARAALAANDNEPRKAA